MIILCTECDLHTFDFDDIMNLNFKETNAVNRSTIHSSYLKDIFSEFDALGMKFILAHQSYYI